MINIVIYEDNDGLREGLGYLINLTEGFHLSGSFSDCMNAANETRVLQPDVILMDIDMPGKSGIEGVRAVKEANPKSDVLMFTVFDDDETIFNAIKAGATGYLLKKTPPARILECIKEVSEGGSPMTPEVARKVLAFYSKEKKMDVSESNLNERETQILFLMVQGNSYKMIASNCGISIDTVRFHIKKIYTKLHVRSMSEAVAKALKERIV